MSSFLDQYNENLHVYRRRRPQRLLKVVIVIVMVAIVAPLTSIIGNAWGPTAAFVVAFGGLLATLFLWWMANLLISHVALPATEPIQPGSPFAQPHGSASTLPMAPPPRAASRGGGLAVALLVISGCLLLFCGGGVVAVVALLSSFRHQHAAQAVPDLERDPFAHLHAQHQQLEDQIRQQERQFREMERKMQRDPFSK